jgi:uncharacterized protein
MKVDLRPLRAERGATLVVTFDEPVASDTDDVPLVGPVTGSLTLTNLGSVLRVEGRLETDADVVCDRCAHPFRQRLRAQVHDDLNWSPIGDGGAETDYLIAGGDTVVLDGDALAREALILALPMVFRCDPECQGLCDRCGADLRLQPCTCEDRSKNARGAERDPRDPRFHALVGWRAQRVSGPSG